MRPLNTEDLAYQAENFYGAYIGLAKRKHPALDPEDVVQQAFADLISRRNRVPMPYDRGEQRKLWVRNLLWTTVEFSGKKLYRALQKSYGNNCRS